MEKCSSPGCTVRASRRLGGRPACARHGAPTVANLKWLARAAGATVDDVSERIGFINLDASIGNVWAANGCHTLMVDFGDPARFSARDRRAMEDEAVADAVDRMSYGMTTCDDPDCDHCHPEPTT